MEFKRVMVEQAKQAWKETGLEPTTYTAFDGACPEGALCAQQVGRRRLASAAKEGVQTIFAVEMLKEAGYSDGYLDGLINGFDAPSKAAKFGDTTALTEWLVGYEDGAAVAAEVFPNAE